LPTPPKFNRKISFVREIRQKIFFKKEKIGDGNPPFGKLKGKIEIMSRHDFGIGKMQQSVGKLQLPAPNLFISQHTE